MFVHPKMLLIGFLVWAAAVALMNVSGAGVIPGRPATILMVFAVSFVGSGVVARLLCARWVPAAAEWPSAVLSLLLPTLLLDPFVAAFFRYVFPEADATSAGVFGGWMLCCSAGALVATLGVRRAHA